MHEEALEREKNSLKREVDAERDKYKQLAHKYDEDVGNVLKQLRQLQGQSASESERARAESAELTRQLQAVNERNAELTVGTLLSTMKSLLSNNVYTLRIHALGLIIVFRRSECVWTLQFIMSISKWLFIFSIVDRESAAASSARYRQGGASEACGQVGGDHHRLKG